MSERAQASLPLLKIVLIASIASIATALVVATHTLYLMPAFYLAGFDNYTTPLMFFALLTILTAIIPRMRRLSPQTAAVLWASISMAGVFTMLPVLHVTMDSWFGARVLEPATWSRFFPNFWAPPSDILRMAYEGGTAVPWNYWLPVIGFWWTLWFLWFIFLSSLMNLLRRRWIDEELLPFPPGIPAAELISFVTAKRLTGEQVLRFRITIAGFLLGVLYSMPYVLRALFPWFPDIYGWLNWPWKPWFPGVLDLVAAFPSLAARLAGLTQAWFNLSVWAIWWFVPLDVLFSWWVAWLLMFIIVPQILLATGKLPKEILQITGGNAGEGRWRYLMKAGVFPYSAFVNGFVAAFAITYLLVNWRYLKDIFSRAVHGPTREELEREPLPYALSLALLLASAVALVGLLQASGASAAGALMVVIAVFLVYGVFQTRAYALAASGGGTEGYWEMGHGFWWYGRWLFPEASKGALTRPYVLTAYWFGPATAHVTSLIAMDSILSYYIASRTQTRPRDVYIAMLVAAILAPLVGMSTVLWFWHHFGASKLPVGTPEGWWVTDLCRPGTVYATPPTGTASVRAAIIGAVTSLLLTWLRARFPWWPLDPIGFFLAFGLHAALSPIFIWLAKLLVLRFGGTRVYERYTVPLAVGFYVGYTFGIFLLGLAGVIRFFVPYY